MKDKELDDYLKKNINYIENSSKIDENVDNMLKNVDYEKKKSKLKSFGRKLKLATMPLLLSSAVVFAVGISVFNLSSIGINEDSIDVAIKNNYIQELNIAQTSNDLMVKINKFLVDDINMDISFEINSDKYDLSDVKNIYIRDLKITDENNNQIFTENERQTNNIVLTYGYSKIENQNRNSLSNSIFLKSNAFPKSKSINISFSEIELHYKNNDNIVNGSWNYSFDVNKEMQERENIEYIVSNENVEKNKNNDSLKINNIKLTNTGLAVNVDSNNIELLNKAKIYLNINNNKIYANNDKIQNLNYSDENSVEYIYTFPITKYDTPNNFELIVDSKGFKGIYSLKVK